MSLKTVPYRIQAKDAPQPDLLVMREVGEKTKEAICKELNRLSPNTILQLDFGGIRFMDVSCADEIVVRVQARLEAGEYPDRFITLSNLDVQHRENIEAALKVAKKAVVVNQDSLFIGDLVNSYQDALATIVKKRTITARELQETMRYKTINEASTKLTFIYQRRLIAREPFREAVRGGGRQFRYLSLLS